MIIDLLEHLNKNDYEINLIDVSNLPDLAQKMNMYSPTLIVFNDDYRWNGPISLKAIERISNKDYPQKRPYSVEIGKKIYRGKISCLTEDNAFDICTCCSPDSSCCMYKGKWIKDIRSRFKLPHLGVISYKEGKCVGGAEFVPSIVVPYDVPKSLDIAFLTCSYLSDDKYDYRTYPLEILESQLKDLGYKKIEAIASEEVVFPNGPLSWFIERGYKDLGEVYYEKSDFARMHIVQKTL